MSDNEVRPFLSLNEEDELQAHEPEIYEALQNIKAHSSIVEIVQWAESRGIKFRTEPDMEAIGESHANGNISINMPKLKEMGISLEYILVHELMHSAQPRQNYSENRKDFGLLGCIINTLSIEAGAESLAMLVYHEMERNGFDHKGRFFEAGDELLKGRNLFKRRYEAAFDAAIEAGESELKAAFKGSNAVFESYIKECTHLKRMYALGQLKAYMEDIVQGRISREDEIVYVGKNHLRSFARLGRESFLADIMPLPTKFEHVFGDNKRLCQVARYVEACRELLGYPESNMKRAFVVQDLRDDNNPFVGVKLNEALKLWKQQADAPEGERRSIVTIMLDLAGYDEVNQLFFNFNGSSDEKTPIEPPMKESAARASSKAAAKLG